MKVPGTAHTGCLWASCDLKSGLEQTQLCLSDSAFDRAGSTPVLRKYLLELKALNIDLYVSNTKKGKEKKKKTQH